MSVVDNKRKYVYRNLPCSIHKDESLLWCVCGHDRITGAGGVLEWCFDIADAKAVFKKMQQSYEFTHLDYRRYKVPQSVKQLVPPAPFAERDVCYYRPSVFGLHSHHEGAQVEVVCVNKHGHITIRFLEGVLEDSTKGIKPIEVACLQKIKGASS